MFHGWAFHFWLYNRHYRISAGQIKCPNTSTLPAVAGHRLCHAHADTTSWRFAATPSAHTTPA